MIQLVKRAMKADTEAFLKLMEHNSLAMYKVARGILNNDEDAADAIQETILICFEKIQTLKKPEYFKTWMVRILINECNTILRHYRNLNLQDNFPDFICPDVSLAQFEFQEMLDKVDEKYRVILILYYVEGFKISEIADLLELNENTVKTRLVRAREQIKREYQDYPSGSNQNMDASKRRGGISNEKTDRVQYNQRLTVG